MPLPEEDERVGLVYADIALSNSAGEVTVPERMVQRQRILERRNEFFPLLTVTGKGARVASMDATISPTPISISAAR